MSTLKEILSPPATRKLVIADCEKIIDEEVASKGLMGMPIKLAYGAVKAVKPGFIPEVIDALLDDFADRLDPMYQAALAKNEPVSAYMNSRRPACAEGQEPDRPRRLREDAAHGQEAHRSGHPAREPHGGKVRQRRCGHAHHIVRDS